MHKKKCKIIPNELKVSDKKISETPKISEETIQKGVIRWLQYQYPSALFCASAGGVRTSMKQAIKMKRTGYKKGFPDLFVYESRKGYNGLAIELKTNKGVTSIEQKEWIRRLTANGYYAKVCKGANETISLLTWYLDA